MAKPQPTAFSLLAQTNLKDVRTVQYHTKKAFDRLVAKGFHSHEMLTAIALMYSAVLAELERHQPGLRLQTHEAMAVVFNEMAGIMPEVPNVESEEEPEEGSGAEVSGEPVEEAAEVESH